MRRSMTGMAGALLLAASLACSGGGGADGTSGVVGGGVLLAGSFVADEPSPAPGSVSMGQLTAAANLVTVAVRVTDADDIFSVGFDVNFDPAAVQYVSWSPGDLLETGGESVIYNVAPHADRVVVGSSRVSPASGANAVGSRAVVELTFRVTTEGSSAVTLTDGALLDSQPPGPSEIPGITWSGGQVLAN